MKTKFIKFPTPDGWYKVNLMTVAINRALCYAGQDLTEEVAFIMNDDYEGIDWLLNSMNYEDIEDVTTKINDNVDVTTDNFWCSSDDFVIVEEECELDYMYGSDKCNACGACADSGIYQLKEQKVIHETEFKCAELTLQEKYDKLQAEASRMCKELADLKANPPELVVFNRLCFELVGLARSGKDISPKEPQVSAILDATALLLNIYPNIKQGPK